MVSRIRSILSLVLILCMIIAILPAKVNATAYSVSDSHKCCCVGMCDCCDKAAVPNRNNLSNSHADICQCSHPSSHQPSDVPARAGHIISPLSVEITSLFTSCETPTHQVYLSVESSSFIFILIPTPISLRAPPVCV